MKTPRIEEKSFEKYLEQICFEANPQVLDDDMPDFFDDWLGSQDGEDYIRLADEYAKSLTTEAHQAGDKGGNERGRQAGINEAVEKMEKEIDGKLETWAALEHSRWSKWQEYLHSKLYEIDDNRVSAHNHLKILPTELWQRWERQIMTSYSDLSEAEKESDREQVRPYIEDLKRTIKALQDKK